MACIFGHVLPMINCPACDNPRLHVSYNDGTGKAAMSNPNHKGPHCAGLCEGAAYLATIKEANARTEAAEKKLDYYESMEHPGSVYDRLNDVLESTKAELEQYKATSKIDNQVQKNHKELIAELEAEIAELRDGNEYVLVRELREQLAEANDKLRWHLITEKEPETALLFIADSNDWSSIEHFWFDDEGLPEWADCWMYAEGIVPKGGDVPIPSTEGES